VAELLDGISEIDWSVFSHAYGSAEEVPRWLAAMTDPATSADALDDLDSAVYHQGGAVYSAGAAVVPCLNVLDAALDPLRHNRQLPVSRQALRHLARIGPAAAKFTPLLRGALEQDERLLYSGGWRGITEDERAHTLATRALAAVTP